MSTVRTFGRWVCVLCWLAACAATAQPMDRADIDAQKAALDAQRETIAETYAQTAHQCWQRFLVNDCLHAARLQRRQALAPIQKQEQALRAAQRALSAQERQQRLEAKQPQPEAAHDAKP